MALKDTIARLADEIANKSGDHTENEVAYMKEDLAQYAYVNRLWDKFRMLPVDMPTRTLLAPFHPEAPNGVPSHVERVFPAGTPEQEVVDWFQSRFCLSAKDEFGYEPPERMV